MKSKLEINPFIENNFIKYRTAMQTVAYGEESKGRMDYSKSYKMDKDLSGKLYRLKEFEENLYTLPVNALKLLIFIAFHLGHKKDSIHLLASKYEEITGIKETSFNNARSTLIKKGIILKKTGRTNMYWVNPHYIFSGDRNKFIEKTYGSEYLCIEQSIKYSNSETDEF
tara:strand:+ start:401 stop:907 length:507 start_codon:yes stop_codon:yes gene_type:complete